MTSPMPEPISPELAELLSQMLVDGDDGALNTRIKASGSCLQLLDLLLSIKQKGISLNTRDKIPDLDLSEIYRQSSTGNINLVCEVLRKGLFVAGDSDRQALELIDHIYNAIRNNCVETEIVIKLYSVVIDYCRLTNNETVIAAATINNTIMFVDLLARCFEFKSLTRLALIEIIPHYFDLLKPLGDEHKVIVLQKLFETIRDAKRLDLFCVLVDYYASTTIWLSDDTFWLLLERSLRSDLGYVRKQVVFLLRKSIDVIINKTQPSSMSQYIKPSSSDLGIDKIAWRNYLLLLDLSQEKQLHLVKPSLPLLDTIKCLHPLWQLCLYEILLNHTQIYIVYTVIENIISWCTHTIINNEVFRQLIQLVLSAINRNKYYCSSTTFSNIHSFSTEKYTILLECSIDIAWTSTLIWHFYKPIVCGKPFDISPELLAQLLRKAKSVQHLYVRDGLIALFVTHFLTNYKHKSASELLQVLGFVTDIKVRGVFWENFVRANKSSIVDAIRLVEDKSDSGFLRVVLTIRDIIPDIFDSFFFDSVDILNQPGLVMDIYLTYSIHSFDRTKYVITRIDTIMPDDSNVYFMSLIDSLDNVSINLKSKSIDIVSKYNKGRYNKAQAIAAFKLLTRYFAINHTYSDELRIVIEEWTRALSERIDEEIVVEYLHLYFKIYATISVNDDKLNETLEILKSILSMENHTTTIAVYQKLTLLIEHANKYPIPVFDLIETKCFDELIRLRKNSLFRNAITVFIQQIYSSPYPPQRLFDLTKRLLNEFDHFDYALSMLAQHLSKLAAANPKGMLVFIPVIVDLMLSGFVVKKDEIADYYVCNDIADSSVTTSSNPNHDQMLTRFYSLDAMMTLIKENKNQCVADNFASLLLVKYGKSFKKRYFQDSQIHLEKLRIIQALLLIHAHIRHERPRIIQLIFDSFESESHQCSVKYLMQWLLILLDCGDLIFNWLNDREAAQNLVRLSMLLTLIPVLCQLALSSTVERDFFRVVEAVLPFIIAPQFKLRLMVKTTICKLYEAADKRQFQQFLTQHKFLYESLNARIDDFKQNYISIEVDCLDSLNTLTTCDYQTIYYDTSSMNQVTEIEWLNQPVLWRNNNHTINFASLSNHIVTIHKDNVKKSDQKNENVNEIKTIICNDEIIQPLTNIQKKIIPLWHYDEPTTIIDNDFVLAAVLIEKPANLGGLTRTCEVFGIREIAMGRRTVVHEKEFKSLSMSAENWVKIVEVNDLKTYLLAMRSKGYAIIGSEQTVDSVNLQDFKFPKKTVLLLGNEKEGIPPDLIVLLDVCLEIPQFGVIRSLNVHVAGAIIAWEYCQQHLL